ncbi:hypothetical protein B296_00056629 [Ensete ventricosum]|uniref:Uncharacterized protein n=1 Tax=Ensete ventricosum TaxID=4639 RepID=A0A426WZ29_ENSVE|nr:hypothetical protein B296_00056629 [Ensete ventricosum]
MSVPGSSSRRGAQVDPRVAEALETMKSCYSSDLTLMACLLKAPKCSNARAYLQPRKKSKVAVSKQLTSSVNGPANSHLDKGKDPTYQGREPAEVEDPE